MFHLNTISRVKKKKHANIIFQKVIKYFRNVFKIYKKIEKNFKSIL